MARNFIGKMQQWLVVSRTYKLRLKKKSFQVRKRIFRNIVVIIKLNQLMEYLPIYHLVLGMYLEVLQCVYPHLPP